MKSISMVCKQCGQPILGYAITALGETWHPEHFVCVVCGRPFNETSFVPHNGVPYHQECYTNTVLPRCVYCGKPLMGQFLVDYWGNKCCKEHEGRFPQCQFCGRLIPPQQQERGSELQRCPVCHSTAIEQVSQARPLFSQIIGWMNSQGLMYNNLRLELDLCGRAHLARLLQSRNTSHSLGVTTSNMYSKNGLVMRTEVGGVAVLLGMPSFLFQGVVVHELGHVWLIVKGIHGLASWAEEGFCELLSHRYYSEHSTRESQYYAQNIEKNVDPIYGEGFRRVRASVEKQGFPHFLNTLRVTQKMPE